MPFGDKPSDSRYNPSCMRVVNASSTNPALRPPDERLIAETVQTKLPFQGEVTTLTALSGDASNRRYFRVELARVDPHSIILMQLADPEGFKKSEEAVSAVTAPITELPFVNVLGHLAQARVRVPRLYHYDQAAGLLYLEDFGDVTLAEACRDAVGTDKETLYRAAIETLVRIHTKATTPANPACVAFHRSFDVPLLMWEFDHFLEYGVVARMGQPMCADDWEIVKAEFHKIAELLASQPRVLTHRDYHSRNLMVSGRRLGVLDFQDALLGPMTYDLASLLRDAYVELDESFINDLFDYYLDKIAEHRPVTPNRAALRRLFDLTSIQRNLKAAGRFIYIDRVKENPKFLDDVPRTLGYVRRNLSKYPELATLRKHLAPYVPELQ